MVKSKLTDIQQSQLIELFVNGSSARQAAELAGVNQSSANYYFHRLRRIIHSKTLQDSAVDKKVSRIKSSLSNIDSRLRTGSPVFGVVNNKSIETIKFSDNQMTELLYLLLSKDDIDALFYNIADHSYTTYDVSKFECLCLDKDFESGECDVNIQEFWQFAKNHLSMFNGVPIKNFDLYLQESTWRYNNKNANAQQLQLNEWSGIQ